MNKTPLFTSKDMIDAVDPNLWWEKGMRLLEGLNDTVFETETRPAEVLSSEEMQRVCLPTKTDAAALAMVLSRDNAPFTLVEADNCFCLEAKMDEKLFLALVTKGEIPVFSQGVFYQKDMSYIRQNSLTDGLYGNAVCGLLAMFEIAAADAVSLPEIRTLLSEEKLNWNDLSEVERVSGTAVKVARIYEALSSTDKAVAYARTATWQPKVLRDKNEPPRVLKTRDLEEVMEGQKTVVICGSEDARMLTGFSAASDLLDSFYALKTLKDVRGSDLVKNWLGRNPCHPGYEEYIPEMPEDWPVSKAAKMLVYQYISNRTVRTAMLRGDTGVGKTTAVREIAAILQRPLMKLGCFSSMEKSDLTTSIVPDTEEQKPEIPWDAIVDPDKALARMRKEYDGTASNVCGVDPADVLEYARLIMQANEIRHGGSRFKMVESEFITALRYGFVCEIAEASRIRDAGVLVAINDYDIPGAGFSLMDGSRARRHENAFVIYTDNVGYHGCRPIDESVLRRNSIIYDIPELKEDEMVSRVVYNTGADRQIVSRMIKVFLNFRSQCREQDTPGVLSVCDFENWVIVANAQRFFHMEDSFRTTVLSKAASIPEDQAELWVAIEPSVRMLEA